MASNFFFLITDLYFLIPAVISQIFNLTAELLIHIRMQTKEGKAEIQKEPQISKSSI